MDEKKGLGYKLQKNPFLVVLLIVVIGVAIFMVSTLSSALKDKIKQAEETTVVETTEATTVAVTEPDDTIVIDGLKKYSDKINEIFTRMTDALAQKLSTVAKTLKEYIKTKRSKKVKENTEEQENGEQL